MGLYSSWPLVGGALSKAIGESFSGLAEGGIQGEEIRHKRANEGIQQQYLQHAMQQLANQQAFQQGTLGWHAMQLAEQAQRDRGTEQWRNMQEQRWGEDRAVRESRDRTQEARWDADREQRAGDREADRAARTEQARQSNAIRWADLGVRAKRASDASQKALAGSTALNQQQKLQLSQLNLRARDIRQQIAMASHAEDMGRAPQVPIAKLMVDLSAVEDAIQEMATAAGGGTPGAGATAPKALPPTLQDIQRKYPKLQMPGLGG